jgi:virginiamycin B lyase
MPPGGLPFGITAGPLGSEWFSLNTALGRLDRQGTLTTYPVPAAGPGIGWLTADPSGILWFAERGAGNIGRIEPNGSIVEFPLPAGADAVPQGIVLGPDGNLWVTEQGANAIARLDPSRGDVTEFPVPTADATPLGLTLGPDGALWFTERSASKVARITLDGTFTEWPLAPGAFPNRIVAGPDGAVWFTELFGGKVGRITPGGSLTEYLVSGGPVGITVGNDRQLYVVLFLSHQVARLDLAGSVTGTWDLPGALGPLQIARGHGLDMWVTDNAANIVFRLTPYGVGQ